MTETRAFIFGRRAGFTRLNSGRGARLAVAVSPLKLQLASDSDSLLTAQRGSAQQLRPRRAVFVRASPDSFSARNADPRSLCPQAHKASIYLLPSLLIRTQSWRSGRRDITDDTQQNTPLTQPQLHFTVSPLHLLRTILKSVEFCSDFRRRQLQL